MDKVRKSVIGTELHIMVETDADTLIGELMEIARQAETLHQQTCELIKQLKPRICEAQKRAETLERLSPGMDQSK